jgi:hypothetical protein
MRHPAAGDHLVQLYQDDAFLAEAVCSYVLEGLRADDCIVLVATPAHRDLFLRGLRMAGVDVVSALVQRRLEILGAAETLAAFMQDGMPDADAFRRTVGGVIESATRRRGGVRAFGEMVDLLWRGGQREAAVRLEELWNDLAAEHDFSLLCAYHLDNLDREAYGGALQCICRVHSHLIPARDYEGFENAVTRASTDVLGQPLADVLRSVAGRARPLTDMPAAQATLLWLKENMPATCDRVLGRLRDAARAADAGGAAFRAVPGPAARTAAPPR